MFTETSLLSDSFPRRTDCDEVFSLAYRADQEDPRFLLFLSLVILSDILDGNENVVVVHDDDDDDDDACRYDGEVQFVRVALLNQD